MLTAGEFSALLAQLGQPVALHLDGQPNPVLVRAIVQDTSKAPEPILNAYGANGHSVQFSAAGLPSAPQRFDACTLIDGRRLVFDLVNPQATRGSGAVTYYVAYSKGQA